MSTPASLKHARDLDRVSGVMPSSPTQSLAEMRTDIGLSCGQTARIAAKTSSG
jgi:hypothetical protein